MVHRFYRPLLVLLLAAAPAAAQVNKLRGGLDATLATLSPLQTTTAVVTFNGTGPVTGTVLNTLRSLGLRKGVAFRGLPIVGVVGTAAQLRAVAALPGVRGVWPNERLTLSNFDARHLTGVEKLRTDSRLRTAQGLPFSGKGIGVLVNDSGIDGTLPDLQFGTRVTQNVLGATNLAAVDGMLPVTYLENVPNTDLSSGHGTHVAGSVGGSGASSGGRHAGMAPGATLLGYGSGAVLFVLDGLGGFDWAVVNQARYNIRVITNSFGSSGAFDPEHPFAIASYAAYQRGITVLFAAGNEGPGEDTHNPYGVIPWVISVGAGDKLGRLADFSSRGVRGETGSFTTPDGRAWTFTNEPTVVAPGVDIVSARATTGALPALAAEQDVNALGANAAFYTHSSGTSMATPITAGIVALMLEANPALQPDDVKRILRATATNMPGYEPWEVGAGYVNAYDAVVMALGRRTDFGATVNAARTFNANALVVPGETRPFSVNFSPVGEREAYTFTVPSGVVLVTARATVSTNTVGIQLTDPNGKRYGSAIALPQLGETIAVSGEGIPGEWTLTVSGVGSVSGVALDPLRLTNGVAAPGTVEGAIKFTRSGGYTGLTDIAADHPGYGAALAGVADRLVDGLADGTFRPDAPLTRGQLAEYAAMGLGARQSLPLGGGFTYADAPAAAGPFVEAATASGGALRDRFQTSRSLVRVGPGAFNPDGAVLRAELAYTLVQSLGLQVQADAISAAIAAGTATMAVVADGKQVPIEDAFIVPAELKGYVQLAIDLGLLNARFELTQGPYDLTPTLHATFIPHALATRADYSVAAHATLGLFLSGDVAAALGGGESTSTLPALARATADAATLDPAATRFEAPSPNPTRDRAAFRFTLGEAGAARLAVYDALGREVARLADGALGAGSHAFTLDAAALPAGLYFGRLETPKGVQTQRLVVVH